MIPINLIRQYLFCPRIVYFNLLTNIKPLYPRHVDLGVDYHNLQNKLSKNRKFLKLNIKYEEILINRYLEDTILEIGGLVDIAFICKNEVIPMEFKDIEYKKPNLGHKLQLIGYGLLLEKNFNKPFKRAIVSFGNNLKFYEFKATSNLKDRFFEVLNSIKDIQNSEIFPNSSATENKCSQCEYLNYCDDRI